MKLPLSPVPSPLTGSPLDVRPHESLPHQFFCVTFFGAGNPVKLLPT